MARASNLGAVSTRQQRIAELAKQAPQMGFTSLNHHIDLAWLYEAFLRTRRDGAPGVDGQTAADYEADLRANLQALLDRAKSGDYRAPPCAGCISRKERGRKPVRSGYRRLKTRCFNGRSSWRWKRSTSRTFRTVRMAFGRDGRRTRHWTPCGRTSCRSVGAGFWTWTFGSFSTRWITLICGPCSAQRVQDGVLLRLIGKWLNAGVLEDGEISYPDQGAPQGGVVSPLLANVYLHYVLDVWFERDVKPRLRGRAFLIRYADDCAPRR